jgi:LPS sulfotransferase NodH
MALAAAALLEGLRKLSVGHREGAHEGPGSMVDAHTWRQAVCRLADDLLRPAAQRGGVLPLPDLGPGAATAAAVVFPGVPLPEPEPWDGQLVVILGCARSGTTWLERMLMATPHAGGVDGAESFLFEQCSPLWQALEKAEPLCDAQRLATVLRRFCDTIFSATLATHRPGATTFVEKTPLHSLRVPELRAVYPEAAYVHLVRDGRDVARSISQVEFFHVPDPADAGRLWRRVVLEVRHESVHLARFTEVRYERLLADPVGGVTELMWWLGLRVDESVVTELDKRAGERVSTHAGTTQQVGRGTWSALPRRDLVRLFAECGGLLVHEGYLSSADLIRAQWHPSYWRRRLERSRRDRTTFRARLGLL